jgi:hypothetical protein
MRLLNTSTEKLEEFMANPPPYAILSHTWWALPDDHVAFDTDKLRGQGEVLFADMQNNTAREKLSYPKVLATCMLAKAQGYDWVWIDTCCIDKSSSAELSEAINSMFTYYQDSANCYVYLDIEIPSGNMSADRLRQARWISRGWQVFTLFTFRRDSMLTRNVRTLQELIAPRHVEFYDKNWIPQGTRAQYAEVLADVTNIKIGHLKAWSGGWGRRELDQYSIADRMSWVGDRQTARPEDIAYCLFGIFDVHLPPLYGEGAKKAFRRLQEEIMKTSTDLSLLAWSGPSFLHLSVLAESPRRFKGTKSIMFHDYVEEVEPFKMTNKGLRVKIPLIMEDEEEATCTAVLQNCYITDQHIRVGVRLKRAWMSKRPAEEGHSVWNRKSGSRSEALDVYSVDEEGLKRAKIYKIYLAIE